MIRSTARPRLSAKVRLRFDRRTGRTLLLYPETGLELNRTATEIAELCRGDRTVDDIIGLVALRYGDCSPLDLKRDVETFLDTLAGRGLLRGLP